MYIILILLCLLFSLHYRENSETFLDSSETLKLPHPSFKHIASSIIQKLDKNSQIIQFKEIKYSGSMANVEVMVHNPDKHSTLLRTFLVRFPMVNNGKCEATEKPSDVLDEHKYEYYETNRNENYSKI